MQTWEYMRLSETSPISDTDLSYLKSQARLKTLEMHNKKDRSESEEGDTLEVGMHVKSNKILKEFDRDGWGLASTNTRGWVSGFGLSGAGKLFNVYVLRINTSGNDVDAIKRINHDKIIKIHEALGNAVSEQENGNVYVMIYWQDGEMLIKKAWDENGASMKIEDWNEDGTPKTGSRT